MIIADISQLSPLWRERVIVVDRALDYLAVEHGAPNRFHVCDISERIPISASVKLGAIRRVGRFMTRFIRVEFEGAGFAVSYARGWFSVTADSASPSYRNGAET